MLGAIDEFRPRFEEREIDLHCPDVVQALSEDTLVRLVPTFDGWILGDDPASRAVFEAASSGRLKAAVKWGAGVDNVDFAAARDVGVSVVNTPKLFGAEVADLAMCYVTALARDAFLVDRQVRSGMWFKPAGVSLAGRRVALVGFGDVGRNTARRLLAADMQVWVYDPEYRPAEGLEAVEPLVWPQRLDEVDYIVLTCALTPANHHLLNAGVLRAAKTGVRIVNVARGGLIDEGALITALRSGHVQSAALDVFEAEPLPMESELRQLERCILGSHNGSNTIDAVRRASHEAIRLLFELLGIP